MAAYSHPLAFPAPTVVARPSRASARPCPWGPPDPSARIDVGWTPGPSLGSPWPAPDPARRVDWRPRAAGADIDAAARTPLPPPPPASLVVAPPTTVEEVAASRSRRGWIVGLALGAATAAATLAALALNL